MKMTFKSKFAALATSVAMLTGAQAAMAEEITVAYFLEWPMPFQYAKETGMYDEALGAKVNWVSFDTGTAMSAAMAAGDVQLSVSQGIPPFVVAASAGQDIQVLDVAVSYADNDNCVVRADLEIDKDSAGELAGKKVAVPLGTAAHYGFLKQMEHFGVSLDSLEIVDMAPAEGEAALSQGAIDMACGWGGALRRMFDSGNVLLTGAEKTALGILVFDATTAPTAYVAENSDQAAAFLAVTAKANAMWADEANRAKMLPIIAKDAGMSEDDAAATLSTFEFPTVEAQLSQAWLGGNAANFMKGVADVFVASGSIDAAKASYADNVNADPLTAAQ
ncbi:ABC transporter substrate-binding protein [Cognatishimia sp.]|uniref:taurine ABC transporter substrate-binding protein n=1 Tax=Cognatishimia sp. TaxID=2211648 RepID=UPI003BA8F6D9